MLEQDLKELIFPLNRHGYLDTLFGEFTESVYQTAVFSENGYVDLIFWKKI